MKLWFKNGGYASKKGQSVAQQMNLAEVTRIAVIRHAALGDMVLTRPFLIELRKACPNALITLSIVSKYTHGVPEDLVDRIHTVYGSDRRDVSVRGQISKARELGPQDIIFDLAATARSFWICKLNQARLKIGFPYYAIQRALIYDIAVLRSDLRFEAEVMLDMLNILGVKTAVPLDFNLQVQAAKRDRPYILYFTGASVLSKCWPADRFAALITRLAKRYADYEHVLLEGMGEWESIDPVMSNIPDSGNITGLKGVGLDEMTSLVQGAGLVISNDTGVRNLAIACEVPTLGIFFDTYPYRYWPRYHLHEVVFNMDASPPSVEEVEQLACKIMDQID